MCCFSPVAAPASFLARLFGGARAQQVHVADTSIFARRIDAATQALVYSMQLTVAGEVAMILPLPVAPGAGEAALSFVSLEEHPRFFEDLASLFAEPELLASKGGISRLAPQAKPKLVVHEVGAFEASFVPTMADFGRLDERFRLPDSVWRGLGEYADYGFAVFRLNPGKAKRIHPMAFRFETRDPARLFFPTVHVHDGQVHREADFDHSLYYQRPPGADGSATAAGASADVLSALEADKEVLGLVATGERVSRRNLRGTLPNRDTWIDLG